MLRTGKKFSKPSLSRVINGDVSLAEPTTKQKRIRLDHELVKLYPEYNRNTLQTFIKLGYVSVDDQIVYKPNTPLTEESHLKLNLPEQLVDPNLKKQAAEKIRPQTIYEDENVLVLDKPAGLLSMTKGEYCLEPTLEDFGLLVHRLDRDTSGVVILAKNPETQTLLRKQFQDRKTHKTYYAIVEGCPKLNQAVVNLPITRNLKHPTTFIVEAGGKESETHYQVLKTKKLNHQDLQRIRQLAKQSTNFDGSEFKEGRTYSLIELKPTTGRTHQLRVHLKYLGTPIVGDRVYGSAKPDSTDRLYLHAKSLEITIPVSTRQLFDSKLPLEFSFFAS